MQHNVTSFVHLSIHLLCVEFCIQSERHEDIAEALTILRDKNPEWNPRYFMTDYSEAETLAIAQVRLNLDLLYFCIVLWILWLKGELVQ